MTKVWCPRAGMPDGSDLLRAGLSHPLSECLDDAGPVPLTHSSGSTKDVMNPGAARVVRRIVAAAGAAGGALALFGSLGLSSAYAEPTPSPTPTLSVTPTPTPTSSSPAPWMATPTPTESATPTSPAPSVADTTPAPVPTELPTLKPSADEGQGVAALAEPVADERFGVVVLTHCGGGDDDTRVEVRLGLWTDDEDLTLDYVLTNDEDITRTGTVTLSPEAGQDPEEPHATLEFTRLPVGSYHIDFLPDGGGAPVTVQNFDILSCLVTAVSCQRITVTNPAANSAVVLAYGDGPGEHEEFEEFDLDPGERRLIRIYRGLVQLVGGTVEGGAGENFSVANVTGEFEVAVPSDCELTPPAVGPDDGLTGPNRSLADTGGSAHAFGALAGGGVLAATGLTLLLRRRLTCVPPGALGAGGTCDP